MRGHGTFHLNSARRIRVSVCKNDPPSNILHYSTIYTTTNLEREHVRSNPEFVQVADGTTDYRRGKRHL